MIRAKKKELMEQQAELSVGENTEESPDISNEKSTDEFGPDHLLIKHRFHSRHHGDLTNFFKKRFVDQRHAIRYAKEHIYRLGLNPEKNKIDDPDFELQDEEDPLVISQVMECLVVMAKIAKKDKAAILIPDYMTMSGNSKLIETALDYVEFDGPVINICSEGQAAHDEVTANETYLVSGNANPISKGLLHNRATHSIQVQNGTYSRVAARLASVIASPDPELFQGDVGGGDKSKEKSADKRNKNRVIFMVAGGGPVVLEHMAQAVEEHIPIVILEGSKRLCDYLPKLWVKRYSAQFDLLAETREMCEQCGFPPQTDYAENKLNLWMRLIVDKGHVNIHPVSSSTHSLSRILNSLQSKDATLLQAMRRYCDYRVAARNMEIPDFRMLIAKLVLGIATTLCVTIAGAVLEPGELQNIIHGKVKLDEVPVPILLLCLSIIVLPGVLSIIMALQHDYNYAPQILALNYAGALVEQEMFRYRACATYYSDEKISAKRDPKADKEAQQDSGDVKDDNHADQGSSVDDQNLQSNAATVLKEEIIDDDSEMKVDLQSARSLRLAKKLIKIGEMVPVYDCPRVDDEEGAELATEEFSRLFRGGGKKKTLKASRKLASRTNVQFIINEMKKLGGVKEVAHHTLEKFDSEIKFGQLSGDDYAHMRLDLYREGYEDDADSLDRKLLVYKVVTYAIGAVSGFLSYAGLEVGARWQRTLPPPPPSSASHPFPPQNKTSK